MAIAKNYKNNSQRIRVMSEDWAANNLYCPCCNNARISHLKNNRPVADFECKKCGEIFELKSKKGNVGRKIVDGAYATMVKRIADTTNPALLILQYSADYTVTDLVFVPKFFFTPDIIEKRKPLPETARRAGWVGCNILYCNIPSQGKIPIVFNNIVSNADDVIAAYTRIKTLQTSNIEARGWLLEILNYINSLKGDKFSLSDVYNFKYTLSIKHPKNHNIEAKIRQQLQLLRDRGFIEFCGRGQYRKL